MWRQFENEFTDEESLQMKLGKMCDDVKRGIRDLRIMEMGRDGTEIKVSYILGDILNEYMIRITNNRQRQM